MKLHQEHQSTKHRFTLLPTVLAVCLLVGVGAPPAFAAADTPVAPVVATNSDKTTKPATLPAKAEPKTGVTVHSNAKAVVDASNLAEGYIMVKYTGGKNVKIKVQIKTGSVEEYTYNLNNAGTFETFPLSEGDGKYTITVFENISGTSYATAYSCSVEMKLRNNFLPFLYSNQYVNYKTDGKVAAKSKELKGATELETLQNVFSYVVKNTKYDYDFAKKVTNGEAAGYLPDVEKVLENKKGICFDYASLMASMLRIQNIPCKLVIGYAGNTYHAWIDVYIHDIGWVDKAIYFDGQNWSLMDPTFASTTGSTLDAVKATGKDYYKQRFVY